MPQINRIRVNNVKYNFGTQYYDDFVMRFSGQNTIYDLANGGGKSVLMLMLLQNLIPNCTLDEKQPIEKLFRSGNDNTAIHSLIEWKLNSSDVKNGFQYMTTGFCARKAKDQGVDTEDVRETAAIEYFNYCIFYREFQKNDILNLPLSDGKERISFQGLKNYLKDLGKKDFSVQVQVFDRKGDYQQFISGFGLYESEWEIIRGINKTEGHVRTYFETHYKTTRKVVEDLLIEEIIEKSFRRNTEQDNGGNEIAKTLLDIKDKLVELSKKKGEISHYDKQLEAFDSFLTRLSGLKGIYGKKAELEDELVKTNHTARDELQDKNRKRGELEEKMSNLKGKKTLLTKNLENARLMEEERILGELAAETEKIRARFELDEKKCQLMETELKELESANDYFEYVEQKKQLEVQKNVLAGLSDDRGEVLEELYVLSYNRRLQIESERLEIRGKKENASEELKQFEEQLASLDKEERSAEKEAAVFESREEQLSQTIQTLEDQMESLCKKTGILLLESSEELLCQKEKEQDAIRFEVEKIRQELQKARTEKEKISWKAAQQQERFEVAQKEHEQARQGLRQLEDGQKKLANMETIYGEKGAKALLGRVLEAYKSLGAKALILQEELEKDRETLHAYKEDTLMCPTETTQKLLTYVKRHFDERACAGCDYIMWLKEEERKAFLEKLPFLPYAIVVWENFSELSVDSGLKEMDFGGGFVPVVSQEALESLPQEWERRQMFFAMQDHAVFYDGRKREHQFEIIKARAQKKEQELGRLEEHERVLEDDIAFLHHFLQEEHALEEVQETYKKALAILKEQTDAQEQYAKQQKEHTKQIKILQTLFEEKEAELMEMKQMCGNLAQIKHLYEQFMQAKQERGTCREGKKKAAGTMEKCLHQIEELRSRKEKNARLVGNLESALQTIEENWKQYAGYYKEDGQFPVLEIAPEELESLFEGKRRLYEQENADVTDKKQLAAAYERAVEKCLTSIRYRGGDIKQLEALDKAHKLVQTPPEQLMQQKSVLEQEQEALANSAKELADAQTKLDRQEGSFRYGKAGYEEKFGTYEPMELEKEQLGIFTRETREQLERLSAESKDFEKEQKKLEKLCTKLESMIEEQERIIENFEIPVHLYDGVLPPGTSLYDTYNMVRKEYERLAREEQSRREDFEKDKARLQETLKMLDAHDLAQEVGRSLMRPRTLQDVDAQMQNIAKTMEYILLEKERVSKGIENMEVIKKNFENRCLQTCSTIKEALERLPNLSVIQLDDKPVHMITLQIPYVRQEQYEERMSHYIDEIVEQTDSLPTLAERLKFIRGRLAWKRLFSVIVKDMDRIKLQLYKRERIKEQSRYLKYEEAVGSTGQSQGIYIQFLVALIHYISCMNAKKADASVQKKVIFLDNPFGAAKDVYIWEPIFKLLQANHVQLIVPSRGATPAITGRFEVNYILGQKMVNGRQQTVVVDYWSEVQTEQLEYREAEFEQGTLELY